MSSWTQDWVSAGRAAEQRAASEVCECGSRKAVGFSNLGIPLVACPVCLPALIAAGKRTVGEAWGFQES